MSSAKWRPFCLGLNVLIIFPSSTRNDLYYMSHLSIEKWQDILKSVLQSLTICDILRTHHLT